MAMCRSLDSRGIWRAALAATVAAGLASTWLKPLNHDVAWFLHAAGRMLDGARLYVDLIDPNPPAIFYLTALPVWLARGVGLAPHHLFFAMVAGLAMASLALGGALLAHDRGLGAPVRYATLIALAAALLILQPAEFGQREHLALILIAPYCCCAYLAGVGAAPTMAQRLAAGALAGMAATLKPHFLVPLLALEIAVCLRRRDPRAAFRPEGLVVLGIQAAYLLHLPWFAGAYLAEVVPLALGQYGAYDSDLWTMLAGAKVWPTILGSLAVYALAGPGDGGVLARTLLLAGLGFAAGFLIQGKGWDYQLMPAFALAVAGMAAALAARLTGDAAPGRRRAAVTWAAAGLAALLPAAAAWTAASDYRRLAAGRYPPVVEQLVAVLRASASGEPVFFLSSSVPPAFPAVTLSGARWPYRYNCLWPLPGFYRANAAGDAGERRFTGQVVDDLVAAPPAILAIDVARDKQAFGGVAIDYLAYFARDARFAELWKTYRHLTDIGSFRLYRRIEGA
ncbi:MAG TPA: hypothetical protein VJJ77_08245 [Dongiaceae bacterium]|nr:hypothetical protein [Dongiaceae bacterium]